MDLQLLHAWLVANWSASYQLRFLASLSLIYSIVRLFQCPQLVQQCLTLRHLNKVIVISSLRSTGTKFRKEATRSRDTNAL